MNMLSIRYLRATALLIPLAAAACSSDASSGDPTPDGPTKIGDERVSMMVDAAAGATLLLDDDASVFIPPGALAADAEVSFSRETCDGVYASDRFQSCVYRVAAPGAELNERLRLSLATHDDTDTPTDCAAALTDDGWRCLVDTEVMDGSAEASASMFTDFTVRTEADDIGDQRCTDVPFEPCGGDLAGDWTLRRACGSLREVVGATFSIDNPYEDCDSVEHYVEYPFSVMATLEFTDGGLMDTYEQFSTTGHTMATEACLTQIGERCGEDCTMKEGICDCVFLSAVGGHGYSDAWTYGEANTFIYLGEEYAYCVEGERLTLEFPSPAGTHLRVYERPKLDCEGCCFSNDDCPEDWFCVPGQIGQPGTCER